MAGIAEAGGPRVQPQPVERTVPRERDEETRRAAREVDEEQANPRPRRAREPETGRNLDIDA